MGRGAAPRPSAFTRAIAGQIRAAAALHEPALTQTSVGRLADIKPSSMSLIWNGRKAMDTEQLLAVCNALGLSPAAVLAAASAAVAGLPDPGKPNPGNLDPIRDRILADAEVPPLPDVAPLTRKRHGVPQ